VANRTKAENDADLRQKKSALLIAYLSYALDDIRPLSARGTAFLVNAIAALRHDTKTGYGPDRPINAKRHPLQ
jgi:hypothetical protein